MPARAEGCLPPPRLMLLAATALVVLTVSAYAGLAANGFVNLDDNLCITANPTVLRGLSAQGLSWAFTTTSTGNRHPLTWLSHMIDVSLFGLRPAGHHLMSLALHAANAVLLLLLLRTLTGAIWRSFLVAALFAVHPLHVESVAWAAERKDVLSTLFTLLAALRYAIAVRRDGRASGSLAVPLLFALALLAKPMPLVLPFVLLLLDWWPLGRWSPLSGGPRPSGSLLPPPPLWLEKAPLFTLAAVSSVTTFLAQSSEGAVVSTEQVPVAVRLANAAVSWVRYLGKAFLPADLAVFYPYPADPWPFAVWGGALLALAALTAACLRLSRRRPYLAVGWLWFLGALVPVIGLVQVGVQTMADRYTYLSLTGIFLILSWVLGELARTRRRAKPVVIICCAAVLVGLTAGTARQVALWRDSATLFRHALAATGDNWLAYNNLGEAYAEAGREGEALELFREAVRTSRGHGMVRSNEAAMLLRLGRAAEAARAYTRIVRESPENSLVRYNFGLALFLTGDLAGAAREYREALRLDPSDAGAYTGLGDALALAGQAAEAEAAYRRALGLDPGQDAARSGLYRLGRGRPAAAPR